MTAILATAVAAFALVGCGGKSHSANGSGEGGVYTVGVEKSFGFTDGFDPSGERSPQAWGIYSNLLVRTLVGYDHTAGPSGAVLVPDIASSVPKPTDHGLTYQFLLRSGIKFGPPLDTDVTSADIVTAFERLGRLAPASLASGFDAIDGFNAFRTGKAKTIAGITTSGPYLVVFRLDHADPNFLERLALPATGPLPDAVAKCFPTSNGYGADVVSTGPYMVEGADQVDAVTCATIKPMSGFDGTSTLTLVRNPDYNAATDSTVARQDGPDSFVFTVEAMADSILADVASGKLNDEIATVSAAAAKAVTVAAGDKGVLHRLTGKPTSSLVVGWPGAAAHVTSKGTLWQGDQWSGTTAYAHVSSGGGS